MSDSKNPFKLGLKVVYWNHQQRDITMRDYFGGSLPYLQEQGNPQLFAVGVSVRGCAFERRQIDPIPFLTLLTILAPTSMAIHHSWRLEHNY